MDLLTIFFAMPTIHHAIPVVVFHYRFFFAQGVAPLVHAHPNVQGHGFHFHVNNARVFQISLGKQNETHAMPVLVEQKCLPPGLVWLPLPLAKRFSRL